MCLPHTFFWLLLIDSPRQVVLYRLDISSDNGLTPLYSLKKLAEWNHNYLVTSLSSFGNHIVVGDQISSVSLLEITGDNLSLEARDYGPLYPVAVEALSDKCIICSNVRVQLLFENTNSSENDRTR